MMVLHIHMQDGSETFRTAQRIDANRGTHELYIWYSSNTGNPDEKIVNARVDVYISGIPHVIHTYMV